jgi:hypothetical protein
MFTPGLAIFYSATILGPDHVCGVRTVPQNIPLRTRSQCAQPTRNMATLTNTLIDFYLSYKRTKIALQWLSTQTCFVGNWESKATFGSTREITDCVKRLPDKYEVPIFVMTGLREAIGARRRVHQMYNELHASASDASAQDSDDAHEAFIAR